MWTAWNEIQGIGKRGACAIFITFFLSLACVFFPISMTDTHHYPKDDLATPSKRLSFLDNDGDTDALSLFPNSPSRFSNKYSDDRYRALVQESPPAGFNVNTPTTDERRESRSITPRSKNSNHTEEFRTVQEWDEVMRRRRSEAKAAATTTAVSSPKKPKHDEYQRQQPERKPLQEPVRDLSVRERSYREPVRDVVGERPHDRYEALRENVRERRDDPIREPVRPPTRESSSSHHHTPIRESSSSRTPISDAVSTPSTKHVEKRFEPESPIIESKPRSTESPVVHTTPPQQPPSPQQRHTTPETIPSYMRSTASYESRIMSSRSQMVCFHHQDTCISSY